MKTKNPKDVANAALSALIEETNGDFGAKKAFADLLSRETGLSIMRQQVQRWLHPDPAKRGEPLLGIGLIMLRLGSGMVLKKDEAAKKLASEIGSLKTPMKNKTKAK